MNAYVHAYFLYPLSDGASAQFKNNTTILNLVHHKADFNLEACWTYTATSHGKGAGDGIGAVLKSTAKRTTLSKNILLSTAQDFYEFSYKYQLETANSSNKHNPGIHVFFLDSKEVEQVKSGPLKARSEQLRSSGEKIFFRYDIHFLNLGKIRGIRAMHEFQPINSTTVQCRPTSRSTEVTTFSFE